MPDQSLPVAVDADGVAARIAARAVAGRVVVVGLTGSVAAGKSVLAGAIAAALAGRLRIDTVSTDGFLFDNATLAVRDLTLRKGFPESYDMAALSAALQQVRSAPTLFPGYSHSSYDVDPALARRIDRPDILLIEGLALAPLPGRQAPAAALDALVYIDASEADLEAWFVSRFMDLWQRAATDPASFYAQFRSLGEAGAEDFARTIWTRINLPNLRDNIAPARDAADLLLWKARDHGMTLLRDAPRRTIGA